MSSSRTGEMASPSRKPRSIPTSGAGPPQFISIGRSWLDEDRARLELNTPARRPVVGGKVPLIAFNAAVPTGAYFPGPDFWRSDIVADTPRHPATSASSTSPGGSPSTGQVVIPSTQLGSRPTRTALASPPPWQMDDRPWIPRQHEEDVVAILATRYRLDHLIGQQVTVPKLPPQVASDGQARVVAGDWCPRLRESVVRCSSCRAAGGKT